MAQYVSADFDQAYEGLTAKLTAHCTFLTQFIGGQPGGEDGVRSFVKHHLKLEGEDAEQATKRILKQEVGEQDTTPEGGEVQEVESYGVNVIRKDAQGMVWMGDWMLKACIKQAASRTGLFQKKRGTKGNFSEGGRVTAIGASAKDVEQLNHVYLVDESGNPVKTEFATFRGRVQTPKGAASIVHDSEAAPRGSKFSFEYHFIPGNVTEEDVVKVLAMMANCGLGSVRSLECGRFRIDSADISIPKAKEEKKEEKEEVTA